ncbi:MAG: glycosyltransferase family 4 protein [Chloroflexi bacterium]|nr:glycosyltransferase family 4 protein [Chloroflexota bacterium]
MRVAYIDYVLEPDKPGTTGLSDLVWDMAGRISELGDDVHVIGPYTVPEQPHPGPTVHRFRIPPIGYRNIAGHILIVLAAMRELRRIGPVDVVHVPEYLTAALQSTFGETPVVLTEPGNIFDRVKNGNPYDPVTTVVFKAAARAAAKRCARLVATSAYMAETWTDTGFTPDRICRIPLGIDTKVFRRVENARVQLGLDAEAPIVLYAARLSRENGVDLALDAFARVLQSVPAAQLHVLGDGPERDRLREQARDLSIADQVRWHGWVDLKLLPAYYSAADVFPFSGRSGGTPRVLIQAMACGAPVIGSAIGGITDHVEHEKTGLLIPPGDSDALAAALERLLRDHDLRFRLGQAGETYAREQVDWDVLARRIRDEVYAPLVDR